MARLEDILKSKGYSDADLQAMAPMLADQRFRGALEASHGELETERNTLKTDLDKWSGEWLEGANGRIAAAEQEAIGARRRAADLAEQLTIAKDWGFVEEKTRPTGITPAAPGVSATPGSGAFDPKAHNLVTMADITRLADVEGRAIAMANDLGEEYRHLTGKTLFEYEGQNGARGMEALRAEAIAGKRDLREYVTSKFDFAGKRQAISAKRQEEHDAVIRKETEDRVRGEMAAKFGNPNMRQATQSNAPFIPVKPKDGAQPWERTADQRRSDRLERAMRNQVVQ